MKWFLILLTKVVVFWALVSAIVWVGSYYFLAGSPDAEKADPVEEVITAANSGNVAKAEELAKKALEGTQPGQPLTPEQASVKRVMIEIYSKSGRTAEAESAARDVLASMEKSPQTSPAEVAIVKGLLADTLFRGGKKDEAKKVLVQMVDQIETGKLTDETACAYGRYLLARSLMDEKQSQEAIKHLEAGLRYVDAIFADHPVEVLESEMLLVQGYLDTGNPKRAEELLKRCVEQAEASLDLETSLKAKIFQKYAEVLLAANNKPEADIWSARATAIVSK